jgi:hypothetical protein
VLIVVAVLLFVAGGADAIAHAIAGPPIRIAGATVHPEAGWTVLRRADAGTLHRVVLVRGSDAVDVTAIDGYEGTAADLAQRYETGVLAGQLDQLSIGDPESGALEDGTPTVRYAYIGITDDGVAVEGIVTTTVGPDGTGVVFDAFAPKGALASVVADLTSMIDRTEVG